MCMFALFRVGCLLRVPSPPRPLQAHLQHFKSSVLKDSAARAECIGHNLWICKPAGLWGGQRIEMEHADDLESWIRQRHAELVQKRGNDRFGKSWVVQKYVERPLCFTKPVSSATEHKVDFRLFVFVSKEGVFCARNFLGRVSPLPFTDLSDRRRGAANGTGYGAPHGDDAVRAHLTNTSVHKEMSDFTIRLGPEDPELAPHAETLFSFLASLGPLFMSTYEEFARPTNSSRPPIWSYQVRSLLARSAHSARFSQFSRASVPVPELTVVVVALAPMFLLLSLALLSFGGLARCSVLMCCWTLGASRIFWRSTRTPVSSATRAKPSTDTSRACLPN